MQVPHRSAALRAGLALALASASLPALAASNVEVAAGASFTTDNESTGVASVAWLPRLGSMEKAVIRAEVGAIHVDGRGHVPGRDLADSVTVGFAGLRYERTDNGLTLGAGVGAQSGETDALSGDPQFVTTAGWRWDRFSLLLRHISNASLHSPNRGETMLVGAWRF
ncbi:acyloxyacyl hydrolase [Luteimonas granuli]|uniref:Acyloxyacyl hydrolase n=1 Tax=Luteimonas granuli TaxID=1176533 RepID=A0A518N3A5_9GAMM|nr:acyloxyacyl hydrolase [Luteimonas granuli]QDW66400.1 acyloxyacyl hydrolase [Luteimonas granuli]